MWIQILISYWVLNSNVCVDISQGCFLFAKESYAAYPAADKNDQFHLHANKEVFKASVKQMPFLTV